MKSIASLHRLTQAVQRANLRRTAGDPTWVPACFLAGTKIFVDEGEKAHLEIIENGSLWFCVGYYGGKI